MATLSVHATAANSPRTEIKAGRHTILIDEPPLFGGNDEAPSPVETLLAALAGALNAIGQYVAREMGMSLEHLDIQIEGDCDGARFFGKTTEQRAGFQAIRIRLALVTDADEGTVETWKQQVLSRCPVLDNLQTPAAVAVDVRTETAGR